MGTPLAYPRSSRPAGTPENSPAIYRWERITEAPVPSGTKEGFPAQVLSPLRGWSAWRAYPAINRWAIFGCPCGTGCRCPTLQLSKLPAEYRSSLGLAQLCDG